MTSEETSGRTRVVRSFHTRGWVVFVLAIGIATLLVSGIVLFVAPSSSIAKTIKWTAFGLDRHAWINLHNVVAILFSAVAVWHLVYNWRYFSGYLWGTGQLRGGLKRELVMALGVLLVIVGLVAWAVPPVSTLGELSDYFRHTYWK
ncbi:DUF4405 domain-containing protein [Blastochloris tepida]|uniref:Flavinylation-associated cytochrome domain-containing protein n=1 Tax=Blastochloris tepida TaxID=2233851 RepID=A0A348FYF1_9HYPH|nr:DUF4405 domain-containing protein [Blastochloris tepida]BBF92334.1 hypothetical protein BLTE_10190 [Blastochloris tepida]